MQKNIVQCVRNCKARGAGWGRGLVAFFASKKATKPRPQMVHPVPKIVLYENNVFDNINILNCLNVFYR